MCDKLVQEYRIWLEELLVILHEVCEDVVPAGRLDEEVYKRTKALYKECKSVIRAEIYVELVQYVSDGRNLLGPVEEALKTVKREYITEETIIFLRRKYANTILTSLQMLVNFAYLAETYLKGADVSCVEASKYFEIDTADEVKRIRSGVVVHRKQSVAKTYRFRTQPSENWKNSVAG